MTDLNWRRIWDRVAYHFTSNGISFPSTLEQRLISRAVNRELKRPVRCKGCCNCRPMAHVAPAKD